MNSLDPWRVIVTDPAGEVVWPRPYYGHPFYQEIPSWIHYGDDNSTTRQLFDGVFIGADPHAGARTMNTTNAQRAGLVAEIAPVVAPATGGITFKKELDDKQILHVEICVDGKCYRAQMDLAPAIAMVMDKLAAWHHAQHAQTVVGSSLNTAVDEAANGMVVALVGRHISTICGSFLDDIGSAIKGAASGLAGGVMDTVKQFKGPIAAAAGTAAAAGAAMIPGVGPIAAPLASKLANDLVNSAIGDPQAQQAVAAAKQQAQTDPTVAVALSEAQKATAHSTVAHHVHRTAKHAAQGQPQAQQQITQVANAAQSGDPAAKAIMSLIASAFGGSTIASGWHDIVGAAIDDVRASAQTVARGNNASVVGVIRTARGVWQSRGFRDADAADDWLGGTTRDPSAYVYAAIFDKTDYTWPYPLNEKIGTAREVPAEGAPIHRGVATTSG
jgi:hypothetical protein